MCAPGGAVCHPRNWLLVARVGGSLSGSASPQGAKHHKNAIFAFAIFAVFCILRHAIHTTACKAELAGGKSSLEVLNEG